MRVSSGYPAQSYERRLLSLRAQLLSSLSPSGTDGPAYRYCGLSLGISLRRAAEWLSDKEAALSWFERITPLVAKLFTTAAIVVISGTMLRPCRVLAPR
jgi:hypothetical protein